MKMRKLMKFCSLSGEIVYVYCLFLENAESLECSSV